MVIGQWKAETGMDSLVEINSFFKFSAWQANMYSIFAKIVVCDMLVLNTKWILRISTQTLVLHHSHHYFYTKAKMDTSFCCHLNHSLAKSTKHSLLAQKSKYYFRATASNQTMNNWSIGFLCIDSSCHFL